MELTQLKYFLTAANCGQIVQAAEMLHISQSAVSMAISRLEKELGVELFEKRGRSIHLTANGERFVDMITPALAELDFAQKEMLSADRYEPDTIVLSVEVPDFATSLEGVYSRLNPKARFRQAMDTTEGARQKLMCKAVDFCLSFEPFSSYEVSSVLLMQEPVLVQLSEENPLSARESLWLSELSETPFVAFSSEYSFRRWNDGTCFLAGFRPNICFEVCDTQSLMSIVCSHNAAAFVGRTTWEAYRRTASSASAADSHVRAVPLRDAFAQRSVYLSYHKNRILTQDAKEFLSFSLRFRTAMERFGSIPDSEKWLISSESSPII